MSIKKSALFLQLEKELKPYIEVMGKAADTIMDKDISKYPILVVHQQELELGVMVVKKNPKKESWNIQASTLEEFAMKQLIESDKIEDFQAIFKKPKDFLCLFVVSELGAKFIFMPRLEEKNLEQK